MKLVFIFELSKKKKTNFYNCFKKDEKTYLEHILEIFLKMFFFVFKNGKIFFKF